MSRIEWDALIVGGGAIGAAAALSLHASGKRVALLELHEPRPWDPLVPDLRVFALAPDTVELLKDLGVWSKIRDSRATPYRTMQVWDAAAKDTIQFDADRFGRRELGWIVENQLLQDALWQGVQKSGIQVIFGQRVASLDESGEGVNIRLEDGTLMRTSYVIAADGAVSSIRGKVGVPVSGHDYGQKGLVAFITHAASNQATCWQRFLPTGPVAFLPFGDRQSSIVWTLPADEAERLLLVDDAAFLRELKSAFDGPLGEFSSVSKRAAFPLRKQMAESFAHGRVLFIGDAAHVVHPLAGQGINIGFRDVMALREVFAKASVSAASIAKWARVRKSESVVAMQSFDAINRVYSNDDLLPTLVRGKALGLVNRIPGASLWFWKKAAGV